MQEEGCRNMKFAQNRKVLLSVLFNVGLSGQPGGDDGDDVIDLLIRKLSAGRDSVPFIEAFSAAGGSCVLSDKDLVAFCGCLFSVFSGEGGGEALGDKVAGV